MRRWLYGIISCLLILAVFFGWWIHNELATSYYGAQASETFVEIPKGASPNRIGTLLVETGVVRSRLPFLLYLRWTGEGRRLQAGDYRFASPATPLQIIDRLKRGDVFFHSLMIPEGLTAAEIATHIARSGLADREALERALLQTDLIRDLDARAQNLEGYLFPDTYRLSRHADADQIVKTMVDNFRAVFTKLRLEHPANPGWDVRKIVILASMVEKEANDDPERGLVASVLVNRVAIGMPLGCDPTVIYALKQLGKYDGNIRKEDLSIISPYNTYINPGLPPGPIANPGAQSLRAALAPPKTAYLYFVARNDGSHEFSKDFQSHSRAVARYQKGNGR